MCYLTSANDEAHSRRAATLTFRSTCERACTLRLDQVWSRVNQRRLESMLHFNLVQHSQRPLAA